MDKQQITASQYYTAHSRLMPQRSLHAAKSTSVPVRRLSNSQFLRV